MKRIIIIYLIIMFLVANSSISMAKTDSIILEGEMQQINMQMLELVQEGREDLTDEDILFVSESKTGYYSIGGPMRLGGILAGATDDQLIKLYGFGKVLGQCFQIVDDLLDLTSGQ